MLKRELLIIAVLSVFFPCYVSAAVESGSAAYAMIGDTFIPVTDKQISQWTDVKNKKAIKKCTKWFKSLSEQYAAGRDVLFTTEDGREINLQTDFDISINPEETAEKFIREYEEGESFIDVIWNVPCEMKNGSVRIVDNYVEVDIEQQKAFLFKDGEKKLETPCVTGKADGSHDTTVGVYQVTYKQSPATLRGENDDGSKYANDVTYWMPFNAGQGLHDAPWRSSFGDSIYKENGSHGCVNLPYDAAKTIYETIDEGWTVVVHQ